MIAGAFLFLFVVYSPQSTAFARTDAAPVWLPATPQRLPRWRGFNLLEKFNCADKKQPFHEEDFRLIAKLGFNFVRLPMDYRCWIQGKDWQRFDEQAFREIDQAIEWGRKYGIHVCLNFHRAPGYTVVKPPEATDLWTDPKTQRVCALHWATFARRYKGIPNERLSFNLVNEPPRLEPERYRRVVKILVDAIRAEDPDRLVIADGLGWGRGPVLELETLHIAEATRGYEPLELSHYHASWVPGSDRYALPTWPRAMPPHGILYGPEKPEWNGPLVIEGPFQRAMELRLHVTTVSRKADLVVDADGTELWRKSFVCGPGAGEWKESHFQPQWRIYQNLYDSDYRISLPAGARRITVSLADGDWLELSELGLRAESAADTETTIAMDPSWGFKPDPLRFDHGEFVGRGRQDRRWLKEKLIRPWQAAQASGIGVFVGEWGAYNRTPHDVALRWMEDSLANWKEAGWGWALWNFRGSFGVLDSERTDVRYEPFEGHQLDRQMLSLLQRY